MVPSASVSLTVSGFRTVSVVERDLVWDGCRNARDLGGLVLANGEMTRFGRVARADDPSRLTGAGWKALRADGFRTVIGLRTVGTEDDEPDPAMIPSGVTVERVELEDATEADFRRRCIDTGFWTTPLEWSEMLQGWPERCATAITAVARACDGGVVISCGLGRDRTGLVAFLVQALVGVTADEIAQDWSRSIPRLIGDPAADASPALQVLEERGTTVDAAVRTALDMDVEARLRDGA